MRLPRLLRDSNILSRAPFLWREQNKSAGVEITCFHCTQRILTTESTSISMLKPFTIDPQLSHLPTPFPAPEDLRLALSQRVRRTTEMVVRLWLTEGVPFAFQSCPAIYEDVRGWLSSRLKVHPKQITLVGSARIGYSLAPPPQFGKPFGGHSDLDLSVVSTELFEQITEAFAMFRGAFLRGSEVPTNDYEQSMWRNNLTFAEKNIPRGFLDASKLPNRPAYAVSRNINQAMWALVRKLEVTAGAPTVRRASTRIYRDWPSLIAQVALNLTTAVAR